MAPPTLHACSRHMKTRALRATNCGGCAQEEGTTCTLDLAPDSRTEVSLDRNGTAKLGRIPGLSCLEFSGQLRDVTTAIDCTSTSLLTLSPATTLLLACYVKPPIPQVTTKIIATMLTQRGLTASRILARPTIRASARQPVRRYATHSEMENQLSGPADNAFNRERLAVKKHAEDTSGALCYSWSHSWLWSWRLCGCGAGGFVAVVLGEDEDRVLIWFICIVDFWRKLSI